MKTKISVCAFGSAPDHRLYAVTGSQWRRTVRIAGRSASWHGVQSSSLLPHARTAADPHRCMTDILLQAPLLPSSGCFCRSGASSLKHVLDDCEPLATDRGPGQRKIQRRGRGADIEKGSEWWSMEQQPGAYYRGGDPAAPGGSHDAQAKAVSWGADFSM
jgi:hypothetical protein